MTGDRRRRELVCRQLVELVTGYLEGELSARDRAAVESHLAQCEHCTGYVAQVRRMLALTADRSDPGAQLPAEVLEALTSAYRARR